MSRLPKLFGGFKSILTLLAITLVTALIIIPGVFNVADASIERTRKIDGLDANRLPKMYDIRDVVEDDEKKDDVSARLEMFRTKVGTNAVAVADLRDGFVRGEESLKQRIPNIKIEYNNDIRIPEVISPKMDRNHIEFLTGPNGGTRAGTLRNFLKENNELIGVSNQNLDRLKVGADYLNPDGSMAFARLEQEINGVPVFRGEVNAGFTKDGRMVRIINNLAPGIDENNVSPVFGDSGNALTKAAEHIGVRLEPAELRVNVKRSTETIVRYGKDDWAPTAEKMYFPTEPGVAVPAWRVLIWRGEAYYVIVEADTQTVLWHKNISDDQTESATFQVYTNPTAFMNVADSVMPLSPYISIPANDPTVNAQGTFLARSNVTLIGNEGPASFNNNGWITNGANVTEGNNTIAGSDMVTPNGVDFPEPGDTACPGAGCRVFTSAWNPQPGQSGSPPPPVDEPFTSAVARRGANIQMFYVVNLWHDEMYKVGFNEPSRNFQALNFGRGGLEGDRVSSEGQDQTRPNGSCPTDVSLPCINNANFATPADGTAGRMQMYLWSGHSPRRDGTGDAEIIIHEVSHGTSNRLIGNGGGLGNQGGMMGEGWGDWYASVLLAQESDGVNGIHALSGYSTSGVNGLTGSYYYGIRRFPTAVISLTGGPNNPNCNNGPCPHNPLTFKHLNTGCDTTLGTTTAVTSAFRRNPVFGSTGSCASTAAPHNAGEIWKIALWEVRAKMVTRLGFLPGTTRVLQAVTSGMKLTPVAPNFLQARDGIIAAAAAISFTGSPELSDDALDVREGFRVRGMGFSASVQSTTAVTEAFDGWTLAAGNGTVASGNGLLEPNECNELSIPVTNNGAATATNVQGVLSTTTPGITVTQPNSAYPDIPAGGGPVNNTTPYQVTIDNTVACFTQANFTLTVSFAGGGGGSPIVRNFSLPVGLAGGNYTFTAGTGTIPAGGTFVPLSDDDDFVVSLPLPAGWTSSIYNQAVTSLSASTNGMLTANGTSATTTLNTVLPAAPGGANPTLFALWDDIDMDAADVTGGGIFTNTVGSSPNRQFIVEWRGQHFAEGTNGPVTVNFAIVLFEGSSNIRYIYSLTGIAPNANGVSATVGAQRANTGTNFTQHSFNQAVITPGLQLDGVLPPGQCTPGSGCSAASAFDVSGRVVNSSGRGIGNALVTMTGGGTRVVRTSSFGYFSFVQVPGSVLYSIAPSAKRYTFTPQQVTPTANIDNMVFTGTP